jgi:hypothetical protein
MKAGKTAQAYLINFLAAVVIFIVLYVLQLTGIIGRYYQGIPSESAD